MEGLSKEKFLTTVTSPEIWWDGPVWRLCNRAAHEYFGFFNLPEKTEILVNSENGEAGYWDGDTYKILGAVNLENLETQLMNLNDHTQVRFYTQQLRHSLDIETSIEEEKEFERLDLHGKMIVDLLGNM